MVDADARIASVRVAEIVPERIDRLVRMQFPDGVGPALREKTLISRARLRQKERIVDPALRLIGIQFRRNDVVVPGKNDWLVAARTAVRIFDQAFEPVQLVIEFRAGRRIAVGKIQAADPQAIDRASM